MKYKDIPSDALDTQTLDAEQLETIKLLADAMIMYAEQFRAARTVGEVRQASRDLDDMDKIFQ